MSLALEYPRLQWFNDHWGHVPDLRPLVIAIGGAAGVGKSSVAAQLAQRIPALTVICTSLIQTILRVAQPSTPLLWQHTYDLSNEDYVARCRPIMACINELTAFTTSERQLYVFEGSSIVPGLFAAPEEVNAIELYMRVTDAEQHRKMLGGPSHDRMLTDAQFERCRRIQEHISGEAARLGKVSVEFGEGTEMALRLIEESVGEA
jgi:2-phosphoglycerate kinase